MEPNEVSQSNNNEIFLSSDFDSNSSESSSPCFVFHQHAQSSSNDGARTPKILSYSSLTNCLALHKKWLQDIIQEAVIRCLRSTNPSTPNDELPSLDSIDDIVVAYISGNSPDMLMSILACSSPETNPAIPALLNTRWTPSEMIASLRSRIKVTSDPSITRNVITIVLHDDSGPFRNAAMDVSEGLRQANYQYTCYLSIPKFSQHFLERATGASERSPPSRSVREQIQACITKASKSDALILFTSGTTGGSKGVRLSHRALLVQALAKLDNPCMYSGETAMLASTVPLFHVGGFSSFLAVVLARGQLVFPEPMKVMLARGQLVFPGPNSSSKFRVEDISNSLRDPNLPSNTLVVVPAMLSSFFEQEDRRTTNQQFPRARMLLIGGQSASREILRRCKSSFPNARIVQTYACTEAASSMTYLSLTGNAPIPSTPPESGPNGICVGSPPSHVELMICRKSADRATSKHKPITKPYELGLIATRGPHVMNGYWERGRQGIATKKSDNRWFISSDLGFWDDQQRLCFAGRAKDVVRTGGETVLAREVEQVLLTHPQVAECAIFPRIDNRYGEAVSCAIVARGKTAEVTIATLKAWCQQKGLAGYKQPKYLFLVNSLPRNSSGKVLKHKLVAKFGNIELRSKL